jgi:TonB family protein
MFRLRTVVAAASVILIPLLCQGKEQSWVEVRSPNFIVVSNAGEKQARKSAVQMEEIRSVFRQSLKVASSHPSPVITVLAVKDENSMRELLPEYWVKGHSHPSGIFGGYMNQFCAAVQLDAPGASPYATFYHEYYHTITVPYFPGMPVWLAEGLAEFYGHTEIDEHSVGMGQADPGLLQELRTNALIPLNVLFQVDHNSPYYNETNKTSIFYAESWALTHYLMIGDRGVHRPLFTAYLDALNRTTNQEEAAATAFGDLKKLQSDLQSYIARASFLYMKIPMSTTVPDDQLKIRQLSAAEEEAYRGEFAVVRGRSDDAIPILQEALRLDSNLALAHEFLGMAQFVHGQRDMALESVSQAITLDSKNYFTHYLRAYLTASVNKTPSGEQVEDDLRQSIALKPDFAPPYSFLAVYLTMRGQNLEETLRLAQKAVSLEPGDSNAQLSLAQVYGRMEKYDDANTAVARAISWARDPAAKANAEGYKSYLERKHEYESHSSAEVPTLKARSQASPANDPKSDDTMMIRSARIEMEFSTIGGYPIDLKPYMQSLAEALRHKLSSRVDLTVGKELVITLEFAVMNDGMVSGLKVASSSGNAKVDQTTQDGLNAATPLPIPPKELKGRPVRFRLEVSYIPNSADND